MKDCLILGMCVGFVAGTVFASMYKPAREVVKKSTDAVLEQVNEMHSKPEQKKTKEQAKQ